MSSSRGYLQRLAAGIAVEDIRGIWVVTDDPAIVDGIREDVMNFFPAASVVVSISDKDVGESPVSSFLCRLEIESTLLL